MVPLLCRRCYASVCLGSQRLHYKSNIYPMYNLELLTRTFENGVAIYLDISTLYYVITYFTLPRIIISIAYELDVYLWIGFGFGFDFELDFLFRFYVVFWFIFSKSILYYYRT